MAVATGIEGMRSSAGQGLAIESDLSRVDAARLNALWPRGGTPDVPPWRPGELGQVLRHQLAASFGAAGPVAGEPPGTAGDLLFRDAAPPVERLRQLKEWAKP